MWAGSQFEFRAPVRVGDAVERTSTIADVTSKEGRTGKLVFVKVRHELRCNGAADPAIVEFHDIVYRDAKKPGDVEPPPTAAATGEWQRTIVPDDVLLFRYSALTFNGHRIHYDRKYVTEVEGYPGLIVHGPLIATLLMDLVRRNAPDAQVASFRFKAVRPTFDLHPFKVKLWAQDHEGWLTMDATAVLKEPA
jgi:3-methylfumaryl-CoA hydratase